MGAETIRLIPSIVLLLAILLFVLEAVDYGRRVRKAREEDPSLAYVPVDTWPPEILEDR